MIHQLLPSAVTREFKNDIDGSPVIIVYNSDMFMQGEEIFFSTTHHFSLFDFAYEAKDAMNAFIRMSSITKEVEGHIRNLVARILRKEFTGTILHMLYSSEGMPEDNACVIFTVMVDTRSLTPAFAFEIGLSAGVKSTAELKQYARQFVEQDSAALKRHADFYFNNL